MEGRRRQLPRGKRRREKCLAVCKTSVIRYAQTDIRTVPSTGSDLMHELRKAHTCYHAFCNGLLRIRAFPKHNGFLLCTKVT